LGRHSEKSQRTLQGKKVSRNLKYYMVYLLQLRFLREKLDCFLKSQHFNVSDEALTQAIMAKNNDIPINSSPYTGASSTKVSNL
jgi:hypothetical protein